MIQVKYSVGSKKPTLKRFSDWTEAIEYCLRLNYEMFLWFDIRQGYRFLSYHTNDPTGIQYSDDVLYKVFEEIVEKIA